MALYPPVAYQSGDIVPGVDPRSHGLLAMNFDPYAASTNQVLTTGLQYLMKVYVPRTITVTNILFSVSTIGATLTAGANNLAVYDSAGNRLGATADQTTNFTTTGAKTVPFTAPFTIQGGPGVFVWLAVKSTGTTPVSLHRSGTVGNAQTSNLNLSAAQYRMATNGTVTNALLPATITPASNAAITQQLWLGLS